MQAGVEGSLQGCRGANSSPGLAFGPFIHEYSPLHGIQVYGDRAANESGLWISEPDFMDLNPGFGGPQFPHF